MGASPEINHLKARYEVIHAVANHSKAREYFNTPEPIDLKEGLRRMVEWVYSIEVQKPTEFFGDIEIREGLPEGW